MCASSSTAHHLTISYQQSENITFIQLATSPISSSDLNLTGYARLYSVWSIAAGSVFAMTV